MRVLVIGGAGYVGGHVAHELKIQGHHFEVLDNLSTGFQELVPVYSELHIGDAYDVAFIGPILKKGRFDAVMHFAALSLVGESVTNPRRYFESNVSGGIRLIGACIDANVPVFILSSSAGVYGEPDKVPISEDCPTTPVNPYGATKVSLEHVLASYSKAYGSKYCALRYFNAAGAHPGGLAGELHNPETHLIPNVLRAALADKAVDVFGGDYPTRDGTCIRDYVHVCDLAKAHVLAAESLMAGHPGGPVNLGSSTGTSVLEIVESARRVTGKCIPVNVKPRRPGDPPVLIADSARARQELGWKPQYTSIDDIMRTAWNWHLRNK